MKYRVHRIEVNRRNMQEKLEAFLNNLEGEVVEIIPHSTPFFLYFGVRNDYILVVEKLR